MQNTAEFKQLVNEAIEENPTIQELKSDVAGLKTDVAGLKTAVQETNHRLDGFIINTNERFDQLDEKVSYIGVMYESLQKDMKIVLEALVPARQRVVQIDQIEERVEDHDHRINAVEITVKGHLADHQGS